MDKPQGWDTLDVVVALQQASGVRPLAHGGRLDVSASGLVLVCGGEGTRTAPRLMQLDKCFEGVIRLGASTRTYDAQGAVWERVDWQHVDGKLSAATDGAHHDVCGCRVHRTAPASHAVWRTLRACTAGQAGCLHVCC